MSSRLRLLISPSGSRTALADTPLHVHTNEDELFYALEGEHVIQVIAVTSGGFEGFFRELADADRAGRLGPDAYAAASQRFGITWL